MKKYFWKITSLVTISVPLATAISCASDTAETVGATKKEIVLTMEQVKNKFEDATSTKIKEQIIIPADDADKTLAANEIGYKVPEGIHNSFMITYTLKDKTKWEIDKKFQITVTITKGSEKATQNIWITAKKPYDFSNAKKLISSVYSTRIKKYIKIPNPPTSPGTNPPTSPGTNNIKADEIGYDVPTLPDGVIISKFTLKDRTQWDTNSKLEITATLQKGTGETAETDETHFTIIAKTPYDFTKAAQLIEDVSSTKIKKHIKIPNPATNPPTSSGTNPPTSPTINNMKPDDMGYEVPKLPDGVIISKFTLKDRTQWDTQSKFKVTATLQKGPDETAETYQKDFIITAKTPYDFSDEKRLLPDTINSQKLKGQITLPKKDTPITNFRTLGFDPISIPKDEILSKYELIRGWKKADGVETNQFKVKVFLKKGDETDTKVITIIAAYDFTDVKKLIKDVEASRTKKKIALPEDDPLTDDTTLNAGNIGYQLPDLSSMNGVSIDKLVLFEQWGNIDGTREKFKVKVFLQKGDRTDTKVITITAKPEPSAAT